MPIVSVQHQLILEEIEIGTLKSRVVLECYQERQFSHALWVSEVIPPVVGRYLVWRVMPWLKLLGLLFVDVIEMTGFGSKKVCRAQMLQLDISDVTIVRELSSVHEACDCEISTHGRGPSS